MQRTVLNVLIATLILAGVMFGFLRLALGAEQAPKVGDTYQPRPEPKPPVERPRRVCDEHQRCRDI